MQAAARRRLIRASLELIKDDEASGRKIGKEGLRATGVSVDFTWNMGEREGGVTASELILCYIRS